MVVANCEAHHPSDGFRQIDMNVVDAGLETDRVLRVEAEDVAGHQIADIPAIDLAPVLLHELVADRRRKCHEAVEIIEQPQLIADEISIGVDLPGVGRRGVFGREAVPLRAAAVSRVQRAIEADQPLGDGALRDLVGRMEGIVHVHAGEREPVVHIALAVVQHQVALVVIVRDRPRSIVVHIFRRGQEVAGAHGTRHRAEPAVIAERTGGHQCEVVGQRVHVVDLHRPGRVEIAEIREIRALAVMQGADQLGDHEIEIGITLAVPVGAHVDRHVVERDVDIGAVIEVKAAQKILVGLALPAVLRDDQSRHDLEHFADPGPRLLLDLRAGDGSLRRSIRREKCRIRRSGYADLGKRDRSFPGVLGYCSGRNPETQEREQPCLVYDPHMRTSYSETQVARLSRQWLWFVVLSLFVIGYAFLAGIRTLSEFDLGWLLATGRWIAQHRQIPSTDVFSYTAQGQPWIYPIGSSLIFYAAWLVGGYALITSLGAAACAATTALLLRRGSVISALLAILAVPLIAVRTRPRADMFTVLLFAAFLALLWRYHRTGRSPLWLLPLLMVAWVNLHLGFVVGLALIAGYVSTETTEMVWPGRRKPALERLRRCWPWLIAVLGATLVNPWGWGIYAALLRQERAMAAQLQWLPEWGSVPLNWTMMSTGLSLRDPGGAFFLMLLITAAAVPVAVLRKQLGAAAFLTGAAILAVKHIRFDVRRPLNRAPTHPGEFFREILEEHLRLSISEAVSRMGISRQSLHAVLRGEAAVTADLVATMRALPFRSNRPFGVRRARREKIAAALFRRDLTFTCHETTEQPVPQHCARALILHETLGRPNWRIPFAGTLRPVLSAPLASRRAGRE